MTEYVRADLYEALREALEGLVAAAHGVDDYEGVPEAVEVAREALTRAAESGPKEE